MLGTLSHLAFPLSLCPFSKPQTCGLRPSTPAHHLENDLLALLMGRLCANSEPLSASSHLRMVFILWVLPNCTQENQTNSKGTEVPL